MEQRSQGVGKQNNGGIGSSARSIEHEAAKQIEDLRARVGEVSERVTDFIKERPGTALLIACGAGFLIGRMLRS